MPHIRYGRAGEISLPRYTPSSATGTRSSRITQDGLRRSYTCSALGPETRQNYDKPNANKAVILFRSFYVFYYFNKINTLNAELNPIRHLLALVGARHVVHISRIRVKYLVLPRLMYCCLYPFVRETFWGWRLRTETSTSS